MPAPRVRLTALILMTACSVGTTGRNYAPAKGPAGATVTLELTGKRTMVGELLAVEPGTLLVLSGNQLFRVALLAFQSGKGPKVVFRGTPLQDELRERLRLISRYPQGVSPELEARLLEAYGQTGIQEVS